MKGILLNNLGSPDSTEIKDVKKYLGEFLMDERVIDIAYWKRWLLINGIILKVRPKKSATAYKKVWWKEGSPLVVISKRFAEKITKKIENSEIKGLTKIYFLSCHEFCASFLCFVTCSIERR